MNESTNKLIEQLAAKLGTTAEYLWQVLIKQAQVNIITNIVWLLVFTVFWIIWMKYHKKFSYKEPYPESSAYSKGAVMDSMYQDEEGYIVVMSILGIIGGIISLIVIPLVILDLITCIFNPAYSALEKVLLAVKSS